MFTQIGQWLEQSAVGLLVRESLWGFPIVVGLHIFSLAFSVGMFLWFDLRLIGMAMTSTRVSLVYRRLMPWATAGFVSSFITGGLLFTGYATAASGNTAFRIKVLMLAVAGANAFVYHTVTERTRSVWDAWEQPPRAARLAGIVSLVAWATVILCGRMMSYTMF
jgi:hypothetical protein